MSFFDAPMPVTDASMPVTDAPALDASMPVDELCKKRRVRATSEEEDEPEQVMEGVEEEEKKLFDLPPQIEADAGEVVEAYAKRPRAAGGDQGDYLGGH